MLPWHMHTILGNHPGYGFKNYLTWTPGYVLTIVWLVTLVVEIPAKGAKLLKYLEGSEYQKPTPGPTRANHKSSVERSKKGMAQSY
jgi:hypothetical protein